MENYTYDLFVIGGGSGGLSASKEAVKFGKKVGLADFVKPSPQGSKWGLGGTCVNVGCIPKKMMYYAANLYESIKNYKFVGLSTDIKKKNDWDTLVENIQNHIYSMNFNYRTQMRTKKVEYFNKLASFVDAHTLELTDKSGKTDRVTAKNILIATGGRPNYTNIPGASEYCISSDDLFSLKKPPGKTLIVGASYIALESAGFLNALGYDTTVMVRSILLRGFDQSMATKIGNVLVNHGIKFIHKSIPSSFTKTSNGTISVEYENGETKEKKTEEFDTVLLAVGRIPDTKKMNIEKAGVLLAKSGKIAVDKEEKSNIDHIYSIGDCADGRPELTPPAMMAGKLLARRLFNNGTTLMDYVNIPTTVFTPLEYGSCGLSEEVATEKFKDKIKVYHSEFTPLEWTFDPENTQTCYLKVIVNTGDNNRVVGFHILSPNAGEITQGIGIAFKCGLTKDQLDSAVGIHPTIAEEMTTLDVTTDQGDGKKTGC